MTLKDLLADGRLRSHKTSIQEVADLLRVVDRDLADAGIPRLSADRRFATAYNRFGEGAPWRQERVRQFFADDELLIGRDFWNFVCKSDTGYDIVLGEYKKNASAIVAALGKVKVAYLG